MPFDIIVPFDIKDSGKRESFDSGMVRDVEDGKTDYTLVLDGPMFQRWADHLTKGAKKYAPRNWMKASGDAERSRFKRSALRHFLQWYWGEQDEDHAAAVFFNINGAEYVREHPTWAGQQPKTPSPRLEDFPLTAVHSWDGSSWERHAHHANFENTKYRFDLPHRHRQQGVEIHPDFQEL